jgi:hypothetical protein
MRVDGGVVATAFADGTPVMGLAFTLDGGELWAMGPDTNVARREADGGWKNFPIDPLHNLTFRSILPVSPTEVWLGGINYLSRFDGSQFNDESLPGVVTDTLFSFNGLATTGHHDFVASGSYVDDAGVQHGFVSRYRRW